MAIKRKNMNILKETSENLQLYFQLGDMNAFKRCDNLLVKNFKENENFPKHINDEIELMSKENVRIDFIHIAYRLYKKKGTPKDFESGVKRCELLILDMYNLPS